uniref:Si:ch211-159i8.4 n=1 Tax=Scleropages formosus TaxID=113540 RepID=A0A8C9R736_SCLFO
MSCRSSGGWWPIITRAQQFWRGVLDRTTPRFSIPRQQTRSPLTSRRPGRIQAVLEGSDARLECKVIGSGGEKIEWMLPDLSLLNNSHPRLMSYESGILVINKVTLSDSGLYHCLLRTDNDIDVVSFRLTVRELLLSPESLNDFSVYLGRPITLDCVAVGKPQAQVSWILPDRTIQAANFSSKGNYKCIASNAAGADTLTYNINVAALPPAIEEEASESTVLQTGGNIYLHCTAKGEPPPTLKWSLPKGIQIKPSQVLGGRLFVFPNGTLYMTSTTSSDSGRYECSAVNAVGMAKRVVQLDIVQGAFSPRQHQVKAMYGSTVYLHCPESMKSPRGALWTLPSKILLDSRYRYKYIVSSGIIIYNITQNKNAFFATVLLEFTISNYITKHLSPKSPTMLKCCEY